MTIIWLSAQAQIIIHACALTIIWLSAQAQIIIHPCEMTFLILYSAQAHSALARVETVRQLPDGGSEEAGGVPGVQAHGKSKHNKMTPRFLLK